VQVAKGSKLPRNPVFYAYYQRKLKEGKTKGQALVCIMRRLVNIVYGMMKHQTSVPKRQNRARIVDTVIT